MADRNKQIHQQHQLLPGDTDTFKAVCGCSAEKVDVEQLAAN